MAIQFTIQDGPAGVLFELPQDTPITTVVMVNALVENLNSALTRIRDMEDELAGLSGYAPKRAY
jgi:hypothetical protein